MNQTLAAVRETPSPITNLVVTGKRPPTRTTFHELLSELNPLQYLPVVGSLYRAITGDRISDEARAVGSLVVSGITGGPVGIAISAAAMAVEKLTGFDPEKLSQSVLAEIGIGGAKSHVQAFAPSVAITPEQSNKPTICTAAWSSAQLAAYGATTTASGSLKQGDLEGSDVLNGLELLRISSSSRI